MCLSFFIIIDYSTMLKLSSKSVYDHKLTETIVFKLINALDDASKEGNGDSYIFDQDNLAREKVGTFFLNTVDGREEEIDFYIEPLSLNNGASASMMTKRENNGRIGIILGIKDDLAISEFLDQISEDDGFHDVFTSIAHEVTHARESEVKPKAYSEEEDKRLHDLKKTDKEKYNVEYTNSEVEFEAIITSIISMTDADITKTIYNNIGDKKYLKSMMQKIESGKLFAVVAKDVVGLMQKAANLYKWPERKRRKAYQKAYDGARYIIENLKNTLQKHINK